MLARLFTTLNGRTQVRLRDIPGPTPRFPLGTAGTFLGSRPWEVCAEYGQRYGGITLIWLFNRPAVVLKKMPPFGDILVCGVSRQLRHRVDGLDEIIGPADPDFLSSGLVEMSLIRPGFLALLPAREVRALAGWQARRSANRLRPAVYRGGLPGRGGGVRGQHRRSRHAARAGGQTQGALWP